MRKHPSENPDYPTRDGKGCQSAADSSGPFSAELNRKINWLKARQTPVKLGSVPFASPLLLAPMSMICKAPFRRLMEELGAGGTVSELVSCQGVIRENDRSLNMLEIHPAEKHVGTQLFGEDPEAMARAAKIAVDRDPKPAFIDINMGCPVRKVVNKGGGSALMKDPAKLGHYFRSIKEAIDVPLTVKIRTGWNETTRNADEIIRIAHEEGLEFVGVHGRSRTQQYKGEADWDYIEWLAREGPLPIIGNGDLHTPKKCEERLAKTSCQALMLARGPLRNPFLFLESLMSEEERQNNPNLFHAKDYWEIIETLYNYMSEGADVTAKGLTISLRKHIVWLASGFQASSKFREKIFKTPDIDDTLKIAQRYFTALGEEQKHIDYTQKFMTSGHG